MSWDNNVYYSPEKFGLTQVECIDFSDGCYQFDYLVVWKDAEGRLFYAEDSGCSCPSPFETMGMPELTRVQDAMEIVSRMEQKLKDGYREEPGVAQSIADFKSKVKRGDI